MAHGWEVPIYTMLGQAWRREPLDEDPLDFWHEMENQSPSANHRVGAWTLIVAGAVRYGKPTIPEALAFGKRIFAEQEQNGHQTIGGLRGCEQFCSAPHDELWLAPMALLTLLAREIGTQEQGLLANCRRWWREHSAATRQMASPDLTVGAPCPRWLGSWGGESLALRIVARAPIVAQFPLARNMVGNPASWPLSGQILHHLVEDLGEQLAGGAESLATLKLALPIRVHMLAGGIRAAWLADPGDDDARSRLNPKILTYAEIQPDGDFVRHIEAWGEPAPPIPAGALSFGTPTPAVSAIPPVPVTPKGGGPPSPYAHAWLDKVPYDRMLQALGRVQWPWQHYVEGQPGGKDEVLKTWLTDLDGKPDDPVFQQLQAEFGG